MIRLTGLWRTRSKTGDTLSGKISPTSSLVILPNTEKKRESDPDFIAYLTTPNKEEEQAQEQGRISFADRTGGKYD